MKLEDQFSNTTNDRYNHEKPNSFQQIKEEYLNFEYPNRTLISNLIDTIYLSQDKTIEIHYKFRCI